MHQKISDNIPSTVDSLIAIWAEIKHSLSAYKGLVPMSPNTTPSAASVIAGNAAFFAVLCIFRLLKNRHYFFAIISLRKNFCSNSIVAWHIYFFSLLSTALVKCPSGWRSTPGKCVNVYSVSRVRIPLSPPNCKELHSKAVTKGLNLYGFKPFLLPQYPYAYLFSSITWPSCKDKHCCCHFALNASIAFCRVYGIW